MKDELLLIDINLLPIINPAIRAFPVFRKIIERDRGSKGDFDGRKKKQAIKELAFIHLYTCYWISPEVVNPFWKHKEKVRYQKLVSALDFPEGWKIDEDIQEAMDYYTKDIVPTEETEMLDGAEAACRQTSTYLKEVDYTRRDVKGNLLYKPKEVMQTIKEVSGLLDEMATLRERVQKKEKASTSKVRGGGAVGNRENPREKPNAN